ncbi:MAG TPA: sigma-70 family RNA polymerase sigma factor [Actinomycetota bacterium]|nr:sigma-70 family RNA polymerase sigma factor [Actinomycetota bacterium]
MPDDKSVARTGTAVGESFPTVLAAARTGAGWAWTALYRDLSPLVLGYLRSRGAREPEDLTGEVFLQVARDLPSFSGGEDEFRSWVVVIAHHRLLDERRYYARRPADPQPGEVLAGYGDTGDVEDEALRNLDVLRVRRLLAQVTDDQREVLMLRIVGGLTVEEVARAVGKRPNTVKALQRRGLAAVKRAISLEMATL